jgi:hypothetical protein
MKIRRPKVFPEPFRKNPEAIGHFPKDKLANPSFS